MIRSIGRTLGQRSIPSDPATSPQQLFGRFSLALWRGNACSWLHRVPLIPRHSLREALYCACVSLVIMMMMMTRKSRNRV